MVKTTLVTLALTIILGGSSIAQNYKVDWHCQSCGGGSLSGGNYKIDCTVGLSSAGFVKSASFMHWIGFWSGDTPTPTVVPSVASAKLLADGTCVSVAGKIATSAGDDFANFFYIEESGRFSGIRVAAPPSSISGLARGSVVNVIGAMGTLASGERQITGPIVIIVSTTTPLTPVGMPNKSLGGGDMGIPPLGQYGPTNGSGLNNIGLLIKTWGRVTATGTGYVEINDGSCTVRVDTTALAAPPAYDSYVSVVGVSSMYESAGERLRLVLPRRDNDIRPN